MADLSLMAEEWEKEASLPIKSESPKKNQVPDSLAPASGDDGVNSSPRCGDENWVEKNWEQIVPAGILAEADRVEEEEQLKELYLAPRARGVRRSSPLCLSVISLSAICLSVLL